MAIIRTDVIALQLDGVDKIVEALREATRELADFRRETKETQDETRSTSKTLGLFGTSLTEINSGLALAGKGLSLFRKAMELAAKPIGIAASFETQYAQIRTLTDDAGADLEAQLKEVAKRVPQTLGDIGQAAYQAISSGQSAAGVADFVERASQLAVAGNTTLTQSVDLLTTTVNAYKEAGLDAATAGDVLFATVRAGKTTVEELNASFGVAAPTAATYKIPLQEVAAALASLTKAGVKTPLALTQINALMTGIAKPSAQAVKQFEKLGVEYGVNALQARGLVGILRQIEQATQGNAEEQGKLFDNVRASRAAFRLLSGGLKDFEADLKSVTQSQGAVSRGSEIMAATTQGAVDRFQSLFEGLLAEAGKSVLPTLNANLERFTAILAEKGPEFVNSLTTVLGLLVEIGVALTELAADTITYSGFASAGAADIAASLKKTREEYIKLADEGDQATRELIEQLFAAERQARLFDGTLGGITERFREIQGEAAAAAAGAAQREYDKRFAQLDAKGKAQAVQSYIDGITPGARALGQAFANLTQSAEDAPSLGDILDGNKKKNKKPAKGGARRLGEDFMVSFLAGAQEFAVGAGDAILRDIVESSRRALSAQVADAQRRVEIERGSLEARLALIDAATQQDLAAAATAGENLALVEQAAQARRLEVIEQYRAERLRAYQAEISAQGADADRAARLNPDDLDAQLLALSIREQIEVDAARQRGENVALVEQEFAERRIQTEREIADRQAQLLIGTAEAAAATMQELGATIAAFGGNVGVAQRIQAGLESGLAFGRAIESSALALDATGLVNPIARINFALAAVRHGLAGARLAKVAGGGGGGGGGAGASAGGGVSGGGGGRVQQAERPQIADDRRPTKVEMTFNVTVDGAIYGSRDEWDDRLTESVIRSVERQGGLRLPVERA